MNVRAVYFVWCVDSEFCPKLPINKKNIWNCLFSFLGVLIDYFNSCFVNVTKQFIEICRLPIHVFINSFSCHFLISCIWSLNPIISKLNNRSKKMEMDKHTLNVKRNITKSINENLLCVCGLTWCACVCEWPKEKQSQFRSLQFFRTKIKLQHQQKAQNQQQ